jgi:hypothetical protein
MTLTPLISARFDLRVRFFELVSVIDGALARSPALLALAIAHSS